MSENAADIVEAAVQMVQAEPYTREWHQAMRNLYSAVGRWEDNG